MGVNKSEEARLQLHMNKTEWLLQILIEQGPMTTVDLVELTGWSQSVTSGLLSGLKRIGEVRNSNRVWEVVVDTD